MPSWIDGALYPDTEVPYQGQQIAMIRDDPSLFHV
jgi:hypothetical protein